MSTYVPDIFEQIISADVVEAQIEKTLRDWMPTYLEEMRIQHGLPEDQKFQPPRSYNVKPEVDRWAEEQLPAVIMVQLGLASLPYKDGEGIYTAPYRIALAIFAQGKDKETTNRNTKVYAAAVRAILLQHRGLDGLCEEVVWEGEDFTEGISDKRGRSIASSVVTMVFHIHHIVNRQGGPAFPTEPDPVEQPGSQWPLVEHPGPTKLDKVSITDEV